MKSQFLQLPHDILKATHWLSLETGETISLSAQDKILWCWMKDRFEFFQSRGQSWFDNQQAIADATGCDRSTVRRFIDALVKHGYITIIKRIIRGCASSNSYQIVTDLQLIARPAKVLAMVPEVPVLPVDAQLGNEEDEDIFGSVVAHFEPPVMAQHAPSA